MTILFLSKDTPRMRKNENKRRIRSFSAISISSSKKMKNNTNRTRSKKNSLTSRYFSKVSTYSFRFTSKLPPANQIRLLNNNRQSGTQKYSGGADTLPKIVAQTRIVGDNQDANFDYSLFTEKQKTPIANEDGVSKFFLRSAASAQASVRSLGPLVYTWIGSSDCNRIRSNCLLHTSSSTSNKKPCNYCWKILTEDAFRHFLGCPIFQKELDAFIANSEFAKIQSSGIHDFKTTCVELVGRWAEEHALRHLCSNQCFQRAFAPSRDWLILRKTLSKFRPIGDVLKDWTCRLVHETEVEKHSISITHSSLSSSHPIGDSVNIYEEDSTRLLHGYVPRTIFVSLKTGEWFPSFRKGRKYILEEEDECNYVNNHFIQYKKLKDFTFDEIYRGIHENGVASPFGLVEELFTEDPWRLLICTAFLNKTQRKQNLDSIIYHLFKRWPTANSVMEDAYQNEGEVRRFVFSQVWRAGLGHSKANAFIRLSRDFLHLLAAKRQRINRIENSNSCQRVEFDLTRTEVKQIYNCGDYAADAYQIFIHKDFMSPVQSNDHMLLAYTEWKKSLLSGNVV